MDYQKDACHKHFLVLSSFMTYHQICNQINTTGATSGAGTANPSGAPEFTSGFQWGSCYLIFSFICMFCRSLFVLLSFFFWPLSCLFFFDLRILITPLVSSNFSYYPSGAPAFSPGLQQGSCYSIFSCMCNVLQIVVCPFVPFLLANVLSDLRFTDSDYPFGIFKLFL